KARTLTEDPQVLIGRYTQELKATPNDVFLLYGLVHSFLAAQEYNEAIKTANKLVSVAQNRPEFKIDQGQAYLAAGKYREAISILKPYYRRHPWNIETKFFLAKAYLDQGDAAEALPLLKSLEKSWPDPAPIYLQIGRCFSGLKKQGEAHYYFYRYYNAIENQQAACYHRRQALKLLPRDSKLYNKLKKMTKAKKR
ncbi:MAG: tetratricopeptide repeat protein, partial [Nitrospiraceae bacterium]|nr:tetratricopeptide repeat protein [Nitrospiraceae bacterium]